jgi:hypothetical protein
VPTTKSLTVIGILWSEGEVASISGLPLSCDINRRAGPDVGIVLATARDQPVHRGTSSERTKPLLSIDERSIIVPIGTQIQTLCAISCHIPYGIVDSRF